MYQGQDCISKYYPVHRNEKYCSTFNPIYNRLNIEQPFSLRSSASDPVLNICLSLTVSFDPFPHNDTF